MIGSFSWPLPDTIHWLGPASWYASLIMSFCAVLLSSSEHFLYAATRDVAQHPDLRRRLNMVVRIRGGAPADLLLSASPPPPSPAAQPPQVGQGSTGTAGGQNSAYAGAPPVRAEVRWNMVFTWQAPMMLLSYSLIGFLIGLTICVLTPLYDGREYDDACKVCCFLLFHFVGCFSSRMTALITDDLLKLRPVQIAILYIVFSIFAGVTFVWCSFWEYMHIDLGDL